MKKRSIKGYRVFLVSPEGVLSQLFPTWKAARKYARQNGAQYIKAVIA